MTVDAPPSRTRDALLDAARAELTEHGSASVSMRAVARRAGVSHAAPAHFFGDRSGLLTAVAAEGFRTLSAALEAARATATPGSPDALAALGRAYVDFGLANPALVDLMFRRGELRPDDAELLVAQRDALGRLRLAVGDLRDDQADALSLVSWAVAHGLVLLAREGVLAPAAERPPEDAAAVARDLIAVHAASVA